MSEEQEENQGTIRCKPGQKAMFIKPMNGYNLGKIVRIICPFDEMNKAQMGEHVEHDGVLYLKGDHCYFTWIVESLGTEIVYLHAGEPLRAAVGPVPDYYLMPLEEFNQDNKLWVGEVVPNKTEVAAHE